MSDPEYTKEDAIRDDLYRWWMDLAHVEAEKCAEKAVEYGANSMTELGHEIAKLMKRTITDAEAIELACYFYIKGKLGRWSDALLAGKPVSGDTLGDIGVYVRMVQRVREVGDWPGWTGGKADLTRPKFEQGSLVGVALYSAADGQVSLAPGTVKVEFADPAGYTRGHPGRDMTVPEPDDGPQPSDGPEYHHDRAAWERNQRDKSGDGAF